MISTTIRAGTGLRAARLRNWRVIAGLAGVAAGATIVTGAFLREAGMVLAAGQVGEPGGVERLDFSAPQTARQDPGNGRPQFPRSCLQTEGGGPTVRPGRACPTCRPPQAMPRRRPAAGARRAGRDLAGRHGRIPVAVAARVEDSWPVGMPIIEHRRTRAAMGTKPDRQRDQEPPYGGPSTPSA
jgi:hypothetical protein